LPIALQSTSLTDALTSALRKVIIAGEIEPGQRLSTAGVAEQFGVAPLTARAGIDRLVTEGILRRDQRKSAYVPKLTAEDITDIYRSRRPIEELAVGLLAETGSVPEAAEQALSAMVGASTSDRYADHTGADIALHRALIAATGSERLRRMHESVMGEAQLCIAQVRRHEGLDLAALTERHADILTAIGSRDPEAAAAAVDADLDGCCRTLLADLASAESGAAAIEGLR
jgi:DNA-binding GntR family transcriptional regulator